MLFLVVLIITVQYGLCLAASCELCLTVSFVTVQYGVCHAVSVFTEYELHVCLTVICYVSCFWRCRLLLYNVSYFWQCDLLLCNMSCFGQHRLCYCAMWAVSGGVIYYSAK